MNEPDSSSEGTGPETVDRRPQLNGRRFDCPRCGAFAQQEWQPLNREVRPGSFTSLESTSAWSASHCASCDDPSIWRGEQLVYPLARIGPRPHADMPAQIAELYQEAATVAAVSPRAGAALARATVERLIKHLDAAAAAGDSLNKRINRIADRASSNLQIMLHVVRETANDVLHQEQPGELAVMVLDDEDGPLLLELLLRTANDLVDELITRQATVQALHEKLPAWVRKKLGAAESTVAGGEAEQ